MSFNLDLFAPEFEIDQPCLVNGLDYKREFITPEEEHRLIKFIDENEWSNDLKRRVQHYGYKYNYKIRKIDESLRATPIPNELDFILERLVSNEIFDTKPDQLIINEYLPGQGITKHTDCIPCFKDTIVMISLNSTCTMKFTKKDMETVELFLEPRSILVCSGESRYEWAHEIPARKSDKYNGNVFHRSRRVSLTFRQVLLN